MIESLKVLTRLKLLFELNLQVNPSIVTNIAFDCRNLIFQEHLLLLQVALLRLQLLRLLLQMRHRVNVLLLQLFIVFLQVADVLKNFLQNIVGRLRGLMFDSCKFRPKELNFFLVLVLAFLDAVEQFLSTETQNEEK